MQFFSVVSSECSACYCTAAEQYVFSYIRKGSTKWHWYGDMCFKQQAVTEFLLEEMDSVTNIHIQLKNVLCGVNVVDTGTVIHWAS
jgi:hypothetical protein